MSPPQPREARPAQRARRRWLERALLVSASLAVSLVGGEIGVRALGARDIDGSFWFRWRRLRPFGPPERGTRLALAQLARPDGVYSPDPVLGWKPRANSRSRDGLYLHNPQGLRVGTGGAVYAQAPDPGVLRVALFGDSLTYGGAVGYESSWGPQLEEALAPAAGRVEVLNFGVTGYGMDQAYLRWREEGRLFAPHVVVFGFAVADLGRNLNLIKGLYLSAMMRLPDASFMPLSKPRFILESEGLRLLNVPTVPPEELPDVVARLESWELSAHERFYDPANYRRYTLDSSKLMALGLDVCRRNRFVGPGPEEELYRIEGEAARVALAIVRRFRQEVEASGSSFLVVHLPEMPAVRDALAGRPLRYAPLLAQLRSQHGVVDPLPEFAAWARANGGWPGLFASETDFHFSGEANGLLALASSGEILGLQARATR